MKKVIIPRKDHEVYFIQLTESVRKKQLKAFVDRQLEKLHPAYSENTCFDIEELTFNKIRWLMVTVMEAQTLAEYRILCKGKLLLTNTSIIVHKKNFLNGGINEINGELIGFDAENNSPVSIPLEDANIEDSTDFSFALKKIPLRNGIFRKRMPRWWIAAFFTCMVILPLISFIFISAAKTPIDTVFFEDTIEIEKETVYWPNTFEILASISSDVLNAGGKISSWHYDEDVEPIMLVQLYGMSVLAAQEIFNKYKYLCLQDIGEVKYIDHVPHITIIFNKVMENSNEYTSYYATGQGDILSAVNELVNNLLEQKINIVSEVLPASINGYSFYSIAYTANGRNLPASLKVINDISDCYSFHVKSLGVSILGNRDLFNVVCTLSRIKDDIAYDAEIRSDINKIPASFGYRVKAPAIVLEKSEIKENPGNENKIGTIKDGHGQMIFYRNNEDTKIKIRVNQ